MPLFLLHENHPFLFFFTPFFCLKYIFDKRNIRVLFFFAPLPPNLCIFHLPLSRLASEQHQRIHFVMPVFPKTTAVFSDNTMSANTHVCLCVVRPPGLVPYTSRAPCCLMGAEAPMHSPGLRSPGVFPFAGGHVASALNPNARPSSPQPGQ